MPPPHSVLLESYTCGEDGCSHQEGIYATSLKTMQSGSPGQCSLETANFTSENYTTMTPPPMVRPLASVLYPAHKNEHG